MFDKVAVGEGGYTCGAGKGEDATSSHHEPETLPSPVLPSINDMVQQLEERLQDRRVAWQDLHAHNRHRQEENAGEYPADR